MVSDRDRERAQVLLVGAVAIAFVIIGLVIVFNSVLFTENVASRQATDDTSDVERFNRIARSDTASLVYRVNQGNYTAESDLRANVHSNLSTLNGSLRALYVRETGARVDVTIHTSASTTGARLRQDDTRTLDHPGTRSNIADNVQFAGFQVLVNVSSMGPTDDLTVEVTGSGGPNELVIANQSGGDDYQISARGSVVCTISRGPTDDFTGDTLLALVSEGRFPAKDSCGFDLTPSGGTGPYTLKFDNPDGVTGKWQVAVDDDSYLPPGNYNQYQGTSGDSPYATPVYWAVNMTVEYRSPSVRYENTQNVTVYNAS